MEETAKKNDNNNKSNGGGDHTSTGTTGSGIIGWFEDVAENAGRVQTETLRRILVQNHGVEYLRKWLGDDVGSVEEMEGSVLESVYRSLVPVVCHADLEPYIERIADGDTSPLLTQQPITTLSLR